MEININDVPYSARPPLPKGGLMLLRSQRAAEPLACRRPPLHPLIGSVFNDTWPLAGGQRTLHSQARWSRSVRHWLARSPTDDVISAPSLENGESGLPSCGPYYLIIQPLPTGLSPHRERERVLVRGRGTLREMATDYRKAKNGPVVQFGAFPSFYDASPPPLEQHELSPPPPLSLTHASRNLDH